MSRNYELLQRVEKERGKLEVRITPSTADPELPAWPEENDTVVACTFPSASLDPIGRSEIAKLAQRLFLAASTFELRMVAFAGIEDDQSSSWMSACLADILATLTQRRVCLADLSLWQPLVHRHFAIEAENLPEPADDAAPPFSSVRSSLKRITKNLWLFPASAIRTQRSLLASDDRQQVIAELRERFDYIVANTAPVSGSAETIALGRLADGMVLVLEAAATRRESAKKAKELLETSGVRVFGAVLNNRTFPVPQAIYKLL